MKTLLVGINSKYIHSSLAIYCLKSFCDAKSSEGTAIGQLEVKEFTINDTYDSIVYGITKANPDVLAISCYIWNIALVRRLVRDLKMAKKELIIILGGPEVSYGLDQTEIDTDLIDYVVQGEGEAAFFRLLEALYRGERHEKCTCIKEEAVKDLTELPSPYTEEYLSSCKNRILYYEASRGCPYRCAYCLSARYGSVRYLSLDRVYKDIDLFVKYNVRQVKFVDRTFNANIKRAKDIIRYIIKSASHTRINFHFEAGGDLFDDELLELLSNAPDGLIQFEIGIQSTNPETLKASSRDIPLEKSFKNIQKLIDMKNINIHLDLIAGLPYETLDLFKKSFNDLYKLRPHQLQLGFLKLLKGSPFEDDVEKYGFQFSKHAPYEIISNKYISSDEIIYLKQFEDCFNRYYNSGRFVESLEYLNSFYDTPYEMFEDITNYFEKSGLTYRSMSSRSLYDTMSDFVKEKAGKIDIIAFKEKLLFDYYSTDKSETVPESLRDIADYSKSAKIKIKGLLSSINAPKGSGYAGRYIKGVCHIFDYSVKNPVNGQYSLIQRFE